MTDRMFSIEICKVSLIVHPVPSVCAHSDGAEGSIIVSIQDVFWKLISVGLDGNVWELWAGPRKGNEMISS